MKQMKVKRGKESETDHKTKHPDREERNEKDNKYDGQNRTWDLNECILVK